MFIDTLLICRVYTGVTPRANAEKILIKFKTEFEKDKNIPGNIKCVYICDTDIPTSFEVVHLTKPV